MEDDLDDLRQIFGEPSSVTQRSYKRPKRPTLAIPTWFWRCGCQFKAKTPPGDELTDRGDFISCGEEHRLIALRKRAKSP